MEERKHMLKKLEVDYQKKGYKSLMDTNLEKQDEMSRHINHLKKILSDLQNHDSSE